MKKMMITCTITMVLALLTIWVSGADAYERYNDGCQSCHGAFTGDTSLKGSVFPSGDKHTMHRGSGSMNTECNLCHTSGDGRDPFIGSSDGTINNQGLGCTGCHQAFGLRAHHAANSVTLCAPCHPNDGTPNLENVMPPYYGTADTNADMPCNPTAQANMNENWTVGDFEGLDNDGDNLYDGNDPDCVQAVCGNGQMEGDEQCDDGNMMDGDCCSANCTFETSGASCDNQNFCDGADQCDGAGNCVNAGPAESCDDGVACTADTCVENACVNTPDNALCDNGFFCDGSETCNAEIGCIAGISACTGGEICNEETDTCAPPPECTMPSQCDDGILCTADDCVNNLCVNTPGNSLCDNGLFCDGAETCVAETGCVDGTPPCTAGEVCDDAADTCNPAPECTSPGECDDGVACTVDDCVNNTCVHAPNDAGCDNGLFCDGAETCNADTGCVNGTSPCTAGENCLEENDICETAPGCTTPEECDDGVPCTADDCVEKACVNTPMDSECDDGNSCTDDTCDTTSGCMNTNNASSCDDGDSCTGEDTCSQGNCSGTSLLGDEGPFGDLTCSDNCDNDEDGYTDGEDESCMAADACEEVRQMAHDTCPADGEYRNHGNYVSCAAHVVSPAVDQGLIDEECASSIMRVFAHSDVGKKHEREHPHDDDMDHGDNDDDMDGDDDDMGCGEPGNEEGALLYAENCAFCHGDDGSGGSSGEDVRGDSAGDIREAIAEEEDMRFLDFLSNDELQSIAGFLCDTDHDGDMDGDDDMDKDDGMEDGDDDEDDAYSVFVPEDHPFMAVTGGKDERGAMVRVQLPDDDEMGQKGDIQLTHARVMDPSDPGYPSDADLPEGAMVLDYIIQCDPNSMEPGRTVTVIVDVPEGMMDAAAYKVMNGKLEMIATSEDSDNTIRFDITDGGRLDEDNEANWVIVDPVVIAQSGTGVTSAESAPASSSSGGGGCSLSRGSDWTGMLILLLPVAVLYGIRRARVK